MAKLNQSMANMVIPNDNDLIGAGKAIIRLQTMYDMKSSDIVNGLLNGLKSNKYTHIHNTNIRILYISIVFFFGSAKLK